MKFTKAVFTPNKTFITISLATSIIISTNAFAAQSCEGINTYPDFPQVDWQGNPDHANTGDVMQFDGTAYTANWWSKSKPGSDGSWALKHVCSDGTIPDPITPPDPTPGGLCKDYSLWTPGTKAKSGDIFVNNESIAYSAKWETLSPPGSDNTWAFKLNCDGTQKGTSPYLSLRNAKDPVSLKVNGWPSDFVVASPSSTLHDAFTVNVINSENLSDIIKLTSDFVSLIQIAKQAGSSSIIISSNVLDNITADKGASLGIIAVKQALNAALATTSVNNISVSDINALSDDAKGWAKAQNLIMSTLAPNATFGWSLSIGDFAYATHSGKRSVWDAASKATSDLLDNLAIYKGVSKADFIAFTKSSTSASLSSDQWHNALEYVKQVTDFVQAPAILSSVPTTQATTYFMGNTAGESKIRKAAHNNIFAILFDTDSATLTSKIASYQSMKVPLYYVGANSGVTPLTSIPSLNTELSAIEAEMDGQVFLYETPSSSWVPSTIYKWADFLTGLNSMHNVGVAGDKFWLVDSTVDDATNTKYAKVAIAAFLSQSMQETIRFDACDENNWSDSRYAPIDWPMTASCGQLNQVYADYGTNPVSGKDHPYSCPRDNKMEQTANTHAKWYGAPAPIFTAPNAVLEEKGLLINGNAGHWTNGGTTCTDVATVIDSSKQVFEREQCKLYVGQKAGKFIWDGTDTGSVEGCGWWGRGVIQTTGRQNFGTLNHFVGRSHVDPDTIGTTIDGTTVAPAPDSPLYADLDLCSNPGLVCSSEEHKEIKWIAGLFFWVSSVQAYSNEGGPYADWNYHAELKKYVDGGMQGTAFVDAVSGIVNRGCPDSACSGNGAVHAIKERRANFKLVLQKLGLNPQ